MKFALASTADLYREHRRTPSKRKRERIAGELQRRHDELNSRPGYPRSWWVWERHLAAGASAPSAGRYVRIHRFDFAIELPVSQPSTLNSQPGCAP